MGSGCSSPLKPFGGKKAKPSERHSSPTGNGDKLKRDAKPIHSQPKSEHETPKQVKATIDNGVTIQSEGDINQQCSSLSSITDDRKQNEQGTRRPVERLVSNTSEKCPKSSSSVANTLGPGSYTANDSQLLVSPALSPALSECLSPAPYNSLQATNSSMSLASAQSGVNAQQRFRASQGSGYAIQQCTQKIFTIKDNHRHVVVTYPDKSCLSVWDIFEEKIVRSINNVDQPRDLKMIDHKRAVILCNRELCVYDLDTGDKLIKLKGVMNQKMPFFEVFGQDYVIALARNRMYVNMLNVNTGELETTFKVGEDRFLNSLLVSANGGICVCGDETQKPFPLLVWNLHERRLMYDLRLDKHEFLTKMSAISDDGHFIVSVCRQVRETTPEVPSPVTAVPDSDVAHRATSAPNFIVIYDLTSGTLFKKCRPGADTCAVAISMPCERSGKVLNSINDNTILVWDLSTGSLRHTLSGHSAPADVIKVQNSRLFSMDSTRRDRSVRLWNIEEGQCLGVFNPDNQVSYCQLSTKGDAIVCCFAPDPNLVTYVFNQDEASNGEATRNKPRKRSKLLYVFDQPQASQEASS